MKSCPYTRHEGIQGVGDIAALILSLDTKWALPRRKEFPLAYQNKYV